MGWSSGSTIFSQIISAIQPEIKNVNKRKAIYIKLIAAFENADWDTLDECLGEDPAYDKAIKELYPDFRF